MTRLTIVLLGGRDLDDAVLSSSEGGRQLDRGLADVLAERQPDLEVEVRRLPAVSVTELAADADGLAERLAGVDIVLRSLEPDVTGGPDDVSGADRARRFATDLATVIAAAKQSGARVFLLNGATFDPADHVSSYQEAGDTAPLLLHRLNLELIDLSMLDGISVIDADRLVAETGGATHVRGLFDFSPDLCAAIRDELAFVLDDYGFFDDRPVLIQQGRRGR
jgi:hypothetical protein